MEQLGNINELILRKLSDETQQIYNSIDKQLNQTVNDLKKEINNDIINKIKNSLSVQIQPSLFTDNHHKLDLVLDRNISSILKINEHVIWFGEVQDGMDRLHDISFPKLKKCYITNYLSCIIESDTTEVIRYGILRLPNDYIDIIVSILNFSQSKLIKNELRQIHIYKYEEHVTIENIESVIIPNQHCSTYKINIVCISKESLLTLLNWFENISNKYYARHSVDSSESKLEKDINEFIDMSNQFYSETGIAEFNEEKREFNELKTNFETEIGQKLFIEQRRDVSVKKIKLQKLFNLLSANQRKLDNDINSFTRANKIKISDLHLFM